ncbi:NUDIX hydrolase [Thermoflavimicrobium dichotomicum]|uniref:NUDIX domain-containing protein n=1 Tax=Thermoflavimicrobium dichotomicum TaxID=46223 RepID=A0A1I3NJA9_9BACL|nr:NUDIX hydrolase [Thermoflavimicrobium dichotomicum]SFJ09225.1 NUDIX domain-containing protein [Thermoflavimicrobium dichotomicum]
MKEISAGGVVYRKRDGQIEILLIRDRFGYISLPKGKIEAGESDEETALREIQEETGISGRVVEKLLTIQYDYEHEKKGLIHKEVNYFLVEALEGKETPQIEEIDMVAWYSPEEAWELQQSAGYHNNQVVLEKAYRVLNLK